MEQSVASAEQPRHGAEHLVPYRWPKGYCPNPSGRPKGSHTVGGALKQIMDHDEGQDAAAIALNLVRLAKSEDPDLAAQAISAAKEILERVDGKVRTDIKTEGEIHIKRLQIDTPPAEPP